MKQKIHPTYYPNAKATCVCGNVITAGSTQEKIEVEICAACHPFYTGKQKVVDSAGRVDRFKKLTAKKATDGGKKKARVRTPRIDRTLLSTSAK